MSKAAGNIRSVAIGLCAAMCLVFVVGCTKAELIIDDPDTAAWMTLSNTFILDPGQYFPNPTQEMWRGVLIQLGNFEAYSGPITLETFARITRKNGDATDYKLADLRWINVVGNDPSRKPPMDASHAGLLYPDPATESLCKDVDACAEQQQSCLCMNPPCSQQKLSKIPKPCVRRRSLHAYLDPLAVITYWAGPNGYRFRVSKDPRHPVQTFELRDKIKVVVHLKDGRMETFDDATRIEVKSEETPSHPNHKDPPGNG